MIDVLKFWIIAYILPIAIAILFMMYSRFRNTIIMRRIVIHIAIFISILLSQFYLFSNGINIFHQSFFSIILFVLAIITSRVLIKSLGFFYSLSSLLQEFCLLSVAAYILTFSNYIMALILTVPIFASTHMINRKHMWIKIILTFIWGSISIYLFSFGIDILQITVLHLLAGSVLINMKILMAKS